MGINGFGELAKMFEGGLEAPILDGVEWEIPCPECEAPLSVSPKDIAREAILTCASCGAKTQVYEAAGESSETQE